VAGRPTDARDVRDEHGQFDAPRAPRCNNYCAPHTHTHSFLRKRQIYSLYIHRPIFANVRLVRAAFHSWSRAVDRIFDTAMYKQAANRIIPFAGMNALIIR